MKKSFVFTLLLVLSLTLNAQNINWLKGSWKGEGVQPDAFNQITWQLEFTYFNSVLQINYPSLQCGGKWVLESYDTNSATFIEKLSFGKNQCINESKVVVYLLDNNYCRLIYYDPSDHEKEYATAFMKKLES